MSLLSRLATAAARSLGVLSAKSNKVSADFLVIAGGGAGGYAGNAYYKAAGGGAGGFRTSVGTSGGNSAAESKLSLSLLNTYTIVVGGGGTTGAATTITQASNSWISGTGMTTIISYGGGAGGSAYAGSNGQSGGSGGGGHSSSYITNTTNAGGSGIAGQGYAGGTGYYTANTTMSYNSGSGGGGAGGVGGDGVNNTTGAGGNGGAGLASTISGTSVTYAGGGGGGGYSTGGTATGGGGNGGNGGVGSPGTANTGGGGGGSAGTTTAVGNNGGSGIVIISYTSTVPLFTGGTVTTSGGKQIHTFTASGTLTPLTKVSATYLVIAGGASGGAVGGGGAGGYQTAAIDLYTPNSYIVTIGAGGAGLTGTQKGTNGSDSSISSTGYITTITSVGGGAGSGFDSPQQNGSSGGSGGGGGYAASGPQGTGGAATSGQGYAGGNPYPSSSGTSGNGAGGGGAGGAGSAGASSTAGGNGGAGATSSISGTSVTYAGGGGGGSYLYGSSGTGGTGGSGGGGNGGFGSTSGVAGKVNSGSGGGSSGVNSAGSMNTVGNGGSGIVIISYAGSQKFSGGTVTTSGGNTIHTFTSSGLLASLPIKLTNSLRFSKARNTYTQVTCPKTSTSYQKGTFSFWFKRGEFDNNNRMFIYQSSQGTIPYRDNSIAFLNEKLSISCSTYSGGTWTTQFEMTSLQQFRDPSAWYHFVINFDTTQAVAANRLKMFVNGKQITSFTSVTYPTQNNTITMDTAGFQNFLGYSNGIGVFTSGVNLDGYLADFYRIDGQQLDPYYFAANDSNGVWSPIAYNGSYGNNGFHYAFNSMPGWTGYATNLNGNNSYLRINDSPVFNAGTSDFCWEFFFYNSANAGQLIGKGGSVIFESILLSTDGSNGITCYISDPSNSYMVSGATTWTNMIVNQWHHLAVYRIGTNFFMALDGTVKLLATSPNSVIDNSAPFIIGGYSNATSPVGTPINGKISNLRYVVGSSVYGPNNFTPPTSALTAITGTQLLTCQSATFVDNSPNALTITDVNSNCTSTSGTVAAVGLTFQDSQGGDSLNHTYPYNFDYYSTTSQNYDISYDVPTLGTAGTQPVGNYNTPNRLDISTRASLTEGNLKVTVNGGGALGGGTARVNTINFTSISGKWYWEAFVDNAGSGTTTLRTAFGMYAEPIALSTEPTGTWAWSWRSDGVTSLTSPGSFANNDVLMFAYDSDTGKLWVGKNGTWTNSGVPASGTNQNATLTALKDYALLLNYNTNGSGTGVASFNFGQRPFTYTPPSGFKSICTTNLPDSTIIQGNKYMDATLYSANGTGQTIYNDGQFKPDLVWIKDRSQVAHHVLTDSVRGTNYQQFSSAAVPDINNSTYVTSFNSNGFTIGVGTSGTGVVNNTTLSDNFVGWQWQAGQGSTSSNTAGSISSTTSVSTTAGFSIVTYTGTNTANQTVGHGLGVTPSMVIIKGRGNAFGWATWHKSLGTAAGTYLALNTTAASATDTTMWQPANNSSTVISVSGSASASSWTNTTTTYVAYCFAQIAGFSAFGSYTGNGSADGPFVYLGFRPKYVLIKCSSAATYNWNIYDSSRDLYNTTDDILQANTSATEFTNDTSNPLDFLANGFKIRGSNAANNGSGATFIYAAFAENPFKYALAR
jgi:hypothetical protein